MTRFSKSFLMVGVAVLALSACSGTKGPGEIGSKKDIVVRSNGLPGAAQAQTAKTEGGDFSSTVEQADALPAPDVETAQALPVTSPATEAAVQETTEASAPMPSPVTQSDVSATPPADAAATDNMAAALPTEPVTAPTPPAPPPAEETVAAAPVYPAAAAPAAPAEPAKAVVTAEEKQSGVYTPAPESVSGKNYPLDPNAPYSPKAIAAAAASAGVPPVEPKVSPSGINLNDPAIIRATQAALAAKSLYYGPQTGIVDASLLNSLAEYQAKNNLPQGGLNEATLKSLGIIE